MQETYTDTLEARIAELESENADLKLRLLASDSNVGDFVEVLLKIRRLSRNVLRPAA